MWRAFQPASIALIVFPVSVATARGGDDPGGISTSDRIPVADGNMVVCRKPQSGTVGSVLIHFHGALETVQHAYARSRYCGVLVVLNFPGLSSAYSSPVADDPQLFDRILARAWEETHDSAGDPAWKEVSLSSFSAGYGAVREILKSAAHFDRVSAIIAADSIYAGLEATTQARIVDSEHMRDFLRFARLASREERRFVLSHSAQATPYASTTETADCLLHALGLQRMPETAIVRDGLEQRSGAARGGFRVLGFDGTQGEDHMRHLHNIDLLWDRCFSEESFSTGGDAPR